MRLEYIFISQYRSFTNQGFDLSNEFSINFNLENSTIKIQPNPLYIEGLFGKQITGYTGIIGENGSGKSTFLNYIKEMLAMPKYNQAQCNCLLIFYEKHANNFVIINNLPSVKSLNVDIDKINASHQLMSLGSLIPSNEKVSDFNSKYTVLESVPNLGGLGIVYLSNLFEPERTEKDYAPQRGPMLFNLSTNYLFKPPRNSVNYGEYLTGEAHKILSFITMARNTIPQFRLPDSTSIFINYYKVSEFFGPSNTQKNQLENSLYRKRNSRNIIDKNDTIARLTKLEQRLNSQNKKKELTKFWLYFNFIMEIYDYIKEHKVEEFLYNLSTEEPDSLWLSLVSALNNPEIYLETERHGIEHPNYWNEYISNYEKYVEEILLFLQQDPIEESAINQIVVPLNSDNFDRLKELLRLREVVALSIPYIINFTWGATSSGESAMLTIFSRLFYFHEYLIEEKNKIDTVWFLLDECDASFHPQWEKQFNSLLIQFINNFFPNIDCQVIFTTHSPFSISDLPKKNLVFLKRSANGIIVQNSLNEHKQTFAANINTLMTDSFFIQDGLIGEFANKKIASVIDLLLEGDLAAIVEKRDFIERLINIIGEPVVKNKLLSIMESRLRANLLQIKTDIDSLKSR